MLKRRALTALAVVLMGTAGLGSLAAAAGTEGDPGTSTPPETLAPIAEPATGNPVAVAQPVAATDPTIARVREKLAVLQANADKRDVAALEAFYASLAEPLWVSASGISARGESVAAEIRKADDWGLSAADFDLPNLSTGATAPAEALADAEIKLGLAVLKYARHAKGGRVDPASLSRYLDQKPALLAAKDVLAAIVAADNADAYLRSLHPKHEQFVLLRQALLKARHADGSGESAGEARVEIPAGPVLKAGIRDARVPLLRQRLGLPVADNDGDLYDEAVEDAVKAFQSENGLQPDGMVANRSRAALNGKPEPQRGNEIERIVLNMERWRWMPKELGDLHVWDNIPEFQMRVVKKGAVIHSEKIIIGKTDTQTPVFSANMLYVIFHPEWGVPDSIKVKEILPHLRRTESFFGFGGETDTRVLQRHNLRVSYNGRPVDASKIDWTSVDIRRFQFSQPPGGQNVLGVVKFRFPNKHDVYMHDTPQRNLFSNSVRAFSHGCMRVQNPQDLAEVLLAEDQGMSSREVSRLIADGHNTEVTLKTPVPVHVTYMTARADDDGKVHYYSDIYGHDRRLAAALEGKRVEPEPVAGDEARPVREVRRSKPRRASQPSNDIADAISGFLSN